MSTSLYLFALFGAIHLIVDIAVIGFFIYMTKFQKDVVESVSEDEDGHGN